MTQRNCPVLAAVVDRYESTAQPVTEREIAPAFRRDRTAIAERLDRLVECELLTRVGGGYRPTVTGREFLELDVECGPIIVDPDG